jgi:hypothetical protein
LDLYLNKKCACKNEHYILLFFGMDDTLIILFGELSLRIKECQEKNPHVDMTHVMRMCILIQSYLDGFIEPSEELTPLPQMTYAETCELACSPRITPEGHIGPTPAMVKYAENVDRENIDRVDRLIQYGKELEINKDTPFF